MSRQQVVVNDFRGGLNVDVAADHISANELVTATNVDYSERGSIRKRYGTEKLNQVSYAEPVTQIFEWNRSNGNVELLAVIGKKLCRLDEVGNKTPVTNLSSNRISYFFLQDKLYFVDGVNYRSYDGEQIKEITVNNITVVTIPDNDGAEPGTYRFVVTFESTSRQESIASEVVEVTTTEKCIFRIENLPMPLTDTAYRTLYVYDTIYDNIGWYRFFRTSDPSVTSTEWNGRVWVTR